MANLISDQDSTKGKDTNINIINGIHNIKGKTSVNILMSNYTNQHIMFNKGESGPIHRGNTTIHRKF